MGPLILLLIILWGWAEVTVFITIGAEIGVLITFLGVFLTAVVGVWLLRSQATNVMASLKSQVTRGEAPLNAVAESLALLFGGILMLTPGYVTDVLGLFLFLPKLRTIIGLAIMSRLLKNARFRTFAGGSDVGFHSHNAGQQWSSQNQNDDKVIEGEAEEKSISAERQLRNE